MTRIGANTYDVYKVVENEQPVRVMSWGDCVISVWSLYRYKYPLNDVDLDMMELILGRHYVVLLSGGT